MSVNWRVRPLLLLALLLAASSIVPQTAEAQVSGPDFQGGAGFDSGSQAPPGVQRDILINRYRIREMDGRLGYHINHEPSLDLAVPRFDPNNRGALEDSLFHVANLGERARETAAPPLPKPPDPSDQGWHVAISPYIWFAGLHGTVGAQGHEASVHASFADIFSYLNIGLMFAVEPRYNRIVMPFDFMWMKLSDDKAFPFDAGAISAKVKVNQDILAQKIGYRVIDAEKFKVDALAGIRYWHAGTTLTVESPSNSAGFDSSADWVDAVGGARIQAVLSPKFVLSFGGDAGGGAANSDYQVAGFIGWKLKRVTLQAGYRYLSVNYRPDGGSVYDITMSGVLLGVTIPLK